MGKKRRSKKPGPGSAQTRPRERASHGAEPSVAATPAPLARRILPWLLAALGGALYFLGFVGFGVWPLAFVCFIPLFFVLDSDPAPSARRALLLGLVFGYVQQAGGYHWLVPMLQRFSGYGFFADVFFASALWIFQALEAGFFALLYVLLRRRKLPRMVAAMVALAPLELLFPALFPTFLANSLVEQTWLLQIVDLGGPILLSLLALSVNVVLYELLVSLRTKGPKPTRSLVVVAALVALSLLYGVYRVNEVEARAAAAEHMRVATVQANMGLMDKRENPMEGLRRHLDASLEVESTEHPFLIVWPESAVASFLPEGVTDLSPYITGGLRTPILFGGLSRRDEHSYNTAFLLDVHGRILSTYDKTHLLAFGEYLPFGEAFPWLYQLSPNSGRFTPGNHQRALVLGSWRIATLICYEDVIPEFTRSAVRSGDANLLVNITNDAWFGRSQEPWIHLSLARFRAAEQHRYLVRATNSGISAVVDPVGRILTRSGLFTQETLTAEVARLDDHTLFELLGSWPGYLGLLALPVLLFWKRRAAAPAKGSQRKDEGKSSS